MMRNGLLSKRKFISMEMSLIMKRGKLLGKNLGNLIASHHHSKNKQLSPVSPIFAYGFQEYEFSCENSPNPIFFHLNAKRMRSYFPCIAPAAADAEDQLRIECSPQCSYCTPGSLVNGERRRSVLLSPYSVRVSNYSMEDGGNDGESHEVDSQAEEFIRRFYEQLEAQSPALLQIQEDE